MAHFAELDENNVVKRVIVVSNDDTSDANGVEKEEIGIAFCKSLFGQDTKWVQTSYNGSFRDKFAGERDIYDVVNDVFIEGERQRVVGIPLENIIDAEVVEPTQAIEAPTE